MISDIKSKSSGEIDRLSEAMSGYIKQSMISQETIDKIDGDKLIKNASARKAPLFRIVSRL